MSEYFKNIYQAISSTIKGMIITFKHLSKPAVTIQYPDVKIEMPDTARNRLFVNMTDCLGCKQCQTACPVDCIDIETIKGIPGDEPEKTSDGKKKMLWVSKFDIDFSKCCYCGLCTNACPTSCIKMTGIYEYSEYEKENLLYNFSALSPEEVKEKTEKLAQFEKEKAVAKAAAAALAAQKVSQTNTAAPETDNKKD